MIKVIIIKQQKSILIESVKKRIKITSSVWDPQCRSQKKVSNHSSFCDIGWKMRLTASLLFWIVPDSFKSCLKRKIIQTD